MLSFNKINGISFNNVIVIQLNDKILRRILFSKKKVLKEISLIFY